MKDILNLGISKVFLPSLLTMPWYIDKLKHYQLHLICQTYIHDLSLFLNCVIIPVIINQKFYFAVDTLRLFFLENKNRLSNKSFCIQLFCNTFKIISSVLNSYKHFNSRRDKNDLEILLKRFSECSVLCNCYKYHFHEYINYEKFFKDHSTQYFRKSCCHLSY